MDPARGIAILSVLAYHLQGYIQQPLKFRGDVGVDAFLLLSGFGLAYGGRDESWWRFILRRLWRLLPAYWLVLVATSLTEKFLIVRPFASRQLLYSFTCTHLLAGDSYGFAMNMSFWFMGLIVPLYLLFVPVRCFLKGRFAGTALGIALMLMAGCTTYLMERGPTTHLGGIGHGAPRLAQFFVGAALGLAWKRSDVVTRITTEPVLLLGLAAAIVAPFAVGRSEPIWHLACGLAFLAVPLAAFGGNSYRILRPSAVFLGVIGIYSYEIYLTHQYLMAPIGEKYLVPELEKWRSAWSPTAVRLCSACTAFAVSGWLAWVLRWITAPTATRRTIRTTVIVLTSSTAMLAGLALAAPKLYPAVKPRLFDLAVKVQVPGNPFSEPVVAFGRTSAADMVFIEHNGAGQARIGIDHWGQQPVYGNWVPATRLTGTWRVVIDARSLEVTIDSLKVRSVIAPHDPRTRPRVGRNDIGFSTAAPLPGSTITRLPHPPKR